MPVFYHFRISFNGTSCRLDFKFSGDISQSLFDSFPVWRRLLYTIVTHYKFDIIIATVIGLNVFFMAIEHYRMSQVSEHSILLFSSLHFFILPDYNDCMSWQERSWNCCTDNSYPMTFNSVTVILLSLID